MRLRIPKLHHLVTRMRKTKIHELAEILRCDKLLAGETALAEDGPPQVNDLESLARLGFDNLSDAETRLLCTVQEVPITHCGTSFKDQDTANDTINSANWGKDREVRVVAEFGLA
jgi:hypothetical protein